jgi:dihydroorotate dehydrogenase
MSLYRQGVRPLLFGFDAERTHEATQRVCHALGRSHLARRAVAGLYEFDDPRLRTTIAGLPFPNPVGLAAGFDKNALASALLPCLGFGAIEIGSVSADPSPGNPVRPRLFRVPADEGLMVNYGVPNDGAEVVAARLARTKSPVPMGISLVETNRGQTSDVDEVITELAAAARPFVAFADYLVLNLNCPNTAGGLSHFDTPVNLARLLQRFAEIGSLPPLFLKITPPRDPALTDEILGAVAPFGFLKGFILNTHAPRPYDWLRTPAAERDAMPGTLTGARLRAPVNDAIRDWYRRIDRSRHVLVAVGGIGSAEHAYSAIRLGASLVQVLTALIYRGPGLVKEIKRGLVRLMERDGIGTIAEAVGADNRPAT